MMVGTNPRPGTVGAPGDRLPRFCSPDSWTGSLARLMRRMVAAAPSRLDSVFQTVPREGVSPSFPLAWPNRSNRRMRVGITLSAARNRPAHAHCPSTVSRCKSESPMRMAVGWQLRASIAPTSIRIRLTPYRIRGPWRSSDGTAGRSPVRRMARYLGTKSSRLFRYVLQAKTNRPHSVVHTVRDGWRYRPRQGHNRQKLARQ
jgi:hypothetical protein